MEQLADVCMVKNIFMMVKRNRKSLNRLIKQNGDSVLLPWPAQILSYLWIAANFKGFMDQLLKGGFSWSFNLCGFTVKIILLYLQTKFDHCGS